MTGEARDKDVIVLTDFIFFGPCIFV